MSNFLKTSFIIVAIIVLSTGLTPWVHLILPVFKFEQILNRLVEIFIIAAIVLFVRVKHFSWRTYGFDFSRPWKRLFGYGFLTGAITILILTALETAFGPRHLRVPILLQDVVERFFKGMLSGISVAVVEEFLFRGFVFVSLEKKLKTVWALLTTSFLYSLVHFLDNGQIFIPAHPALGDSIRLLAGYLEPILKRPAVIFPEFVGLFLFGIALNIAFVRSRTLFASIGVHAGCVFLIKFQNSFIRKGEEVYHPWFGNTPLYDGVFEWVFLLMLGAFLYYTFSEVKRTGNFDAPVSHGAKR